MLLIPCPWCGPRDEIEFAARGEIAARPADPARTDDATWTDYLFARGNARGPIRERWAHVHGCGQVFAIERDTMTNAIIPATGA